MSELHLWALPVVLLWMAAIACAVGERKGWTPDGGQGDITVALVGTAMMF
jgi:cytochrome c-type biogenesis protein CcmH/NrfF